MSTDLTNIKHISLDFWNTIAVPNKDFAHARTWAIIRAADLGHFNTAQQKYTATKKILDGLAELTGFGTSSLNCWKLLNTQFKKPLDSVEALMDDVIQLFNKYPPTIPTELPGLLQQVKDRGINVGILSNTNFIPGRVLRSGILKETFGENFFVASIFSDEWALAKPNPDFFSGMLRFATNKASCQNDQVLHIGDNEITDVQGAEWAGIQSLHVTDPADLVRLLQGMLE